MALITNITPGIPPLLWSNVETAFNQVNQNFQELAVSVDSRYLKTAVYADDTARDLAIPSPAVGMIIFNTATGKFQGNTDGTVSGWAALN
jgi:hypothetical protein